MLRIIYVGYLDTCNKIQNTLIGDEKNQPFKNVFWLLVKHNPVLELNLRFC